MSERIVIVEDNPRVVVAAVGLQGPPGAPGASGGTVVVHVQSTPSTSWTITHAFGREPNVVVIIAGELVLADVVYPTSTTVVINFGSVQSGKAVLS